MRCFDKIHPIVEFLYFLIVIVVTAFTLNPIIACASFIFAVIFCAIYVGVKNVLKSLACALPLMIVVALVNPLFVHKGETILFFLNDNPVTKEAIVYGVVSSVTIAAVYYWCKAYNQIVTSDKFIYLFGRVSPKLSLLLSLTIAFVPKLKRKYREIDEAQKTLGIYSSGGFVDKIASKFRVLSALLTDSLESSVMTADSMHARGYGLRGRTSFSPFVFGKSDAVSLVAVLLSGVVSIVLLALGIGSFVYYPTMSAFSFGAADIALYGLTAFVFALPSILELEEEMRWVYLKSKI